MADNHNSDLVRRLKKLTALKDHASTLPAIREEASRAEQRLREKLRPPAGPGQFRRGGDEEYGVYGKLGMAPGMSIEELFGRMATEASPMQQHIFDTLQRQTRAGFWWDYFKPTRKG